MDRTVRALFLGVLFAAAIAGVSSAQELRPRVDHHTHLWSADASAVMIDPLLPAVDVPAPLSALLTHLVDHSDLAALGQLYAADAVFVDIRGPTWIRGRAAIVRFFSDVQPGYRLTPNAWRLGQDVGFVTGTVTRGEGAGLVHRRNFHLSLVREEGVWRVAAASWSEGAPPIPHALSTEALIAELDEGHIARAAVFSGAHLFASAQEAPRADEREMVRRENAWLAHEVARFPSRLIGLCSLNPLRDYAAEEVRYCIQVQGLRGLKLHFADSGVDLLNPDHRRRLRPVFRAASSLHIPIVIHVDTGSTQHDPREVGYLLDLAADAPDSPIQIAHLGGNGPGLDAEWRLNGFEQAVAAGDRRMHNIYFDVSSVVTAASSPDDLTTVAAHLRRLGLNRILFGSDRSGSRNDPPGEAWRAFRRLPLTDAEFATVANNSLY